MAKLIIDLPKIVENFRIINQLCSKNNLELVTVAKLCLTNIDIVKPIIDAGARIIGETNLVNLANLPYSVEKMLLRSSSSDIRSGLDGCDYVLLSELSLLEELAHSKARARNGVFISVELGDLRDGVCLESLPSFVEKSLAIKGVEIKGMAANFGCLHGMIPNTATLDTIEESLHQIKRKLKFTFQQISLGGTAIFDLIHSGDLAGRVNQVRIGEAIFFGHNMSMRKDIPDLHTDAMFLSGEIIELREKLIPDERAPGYNAFGHRARYATAGMRKRAVLDFGELAAPTRSLKPTIEGTVFAGATHDYSVLDVTDSRVSLSVGDEVYFDVTYNSAAQAIMSPYVEKVIKESPVNQAGGG